MKNTFLNDNEQLNGLSFVNEENKKRIFILEGMGDCSSRYIKFAELLFTKGFDVHIIDTYGQGENVKEDLSNLGIWPENGLIKFANFVGKIMTNMSKDGKENYIFAHSMGCFIGQYLIEFYPTLIKKIILCGCNYKNDFLNCGYLLARLTTKKKDRFQKSKLMNKLMFGGFNKKINNPRTKFDWISYNEKNVDDFINNPKCAFTPTKGFCLDLIRCLKCIYKYSNTKKINKDLSILLISGSDDPVTNYSEDISKLIIWYKEHEIYSVFGKTYASFRHELINENNNQIIIDDILEFIA